MKRTSILILVFFLTLLGTKDGFPQEIRVDTIKINKTRVIRIATVRTIPKFILELSGIFNSGALELSAHNGGFSAEDFRRGRNYAARNGYGVSVTGKLPLNRKGKFWLDGIASFNRFESNLIAKNTEEGQIAYNVFSGGIGIDYNFTSTHKVKYFFGGNPLFSVITGKGQIRSAYDSTVKYNVKIKPSFRIGYSVFLGLEYAFEKSVGLNFGVRFTHANLLLKNSPPGTDSSETELNDDAVDPDNPQLYSGWKQFAYTSVFAGVSYYFRVREKRYKLP